MSQDTLQSADMEAAAESQFFREAMLKSHNYCRKTIDLPPLEWRPDLETLAFQLASVFAQKGQLDPSDVVKCPIEGDCSQWCCVDVLSPGTAAQLCCEPMLDAAASGDALQGNPVFSRTTTAMGAARVIGQHGTAVMCIYVPPLRKQANPVSQATPASSSVEAITDPSVNAEPMPSEKKPTAPISARMLAAKASATPTAVAPLPPSSRPKSARVVRPLREPAPSHFIRSSQLIVKNATLMHLNEIRKSLGLLPLHWAEDLHLRAKALVTMYAEKGVLTEADITANTEGCVCHSWHTTALLLPADAIEKCAAGMKGSQASLNGSFKVTGSEADSYTSLRWPCTSAVGAAVISRPTGTFVVCLFSPPPPRAKRPPSPTSSHGSSSQTTSSQEQHPIPAMPSSESKPHPNSSESAPAPIQESLNEDIFARRLVRHPAELNNHSFPGLYVQQSTTRHASMTASQRRRSASPSHLALASLASSLQSDTTLSATGSSSPKSSPKLRSRALSDIVTRTPPSRSHRTPSRDNSLEGLGSPKAKATTDASVNMLGNSVQSPKGHSQPQDVSRKTVLVMSPSSSKPIVRFQNPRSPPLTASTTAMAAHSSPHSSNSKADRQDSFKGGEVSTHGSHDSDDLLRVQSVMFHNTVTPQDPIRRRWLSDGVLGTSRNGFHHGNNDVLGGDQDVKGRRVLSMETTSTVSYESKGSSAGGSAPPSKQNRVEAIRRSGTPPKVPSSSPTRVADRVVHSAKTAVRSRTSPNPPSTSSGLHHPQGASPKNISRCATDTAVRRLSNSDNATRPPNRSRTPRLELTGQKTADHSTHSPTTNSRSSQLLLPGSHLTAPARRTFYF